MRPAVSVIIPNYNGRPHLPACLSSLRCQRLADFETILVDDGVATGSTVLASLRALRKQKPARLILAIPIGPGDTVQRLACECDQVVVWDTPYPFCAVGRFYVRFDQTEDEEVVELLAESKRRVRNGESQVTRGE